MQSTEPRLEDSVNWKLVWACFLGALDIAAFIAAAYFVIQDDYAKATFWLVMSVSMELSCQRAFRRAAGLSSF